MTVDVGVVEDLTPGGEPLHVGRLQLRLRRHASRRVLEIRGVLAAREAPTVERVLAALTADDATPVVCDLSGLEYVQPQYVAVLVPTAVVRDGVPVVLAGPRGQVARILRALGVQRQVPVVPRQQALDRRSTPALRRSWRGAPDVHAPHDARQFAAVVCDDWSVRDLVDDVVLVTSELVTNVVVHARSAFLLDLDRVQRGVRVSVHDDGPLGRVRAGAYTDRPHGLDIVSALAAEWGVLQELPRGKAVWARLDAAR